MGKDELQKALILEAEERVRRLWAEAEREVADLRAEVAERQKDAERRIERRRQESLAVIRSEARQQAWQVAHQARLAAEQRLGERLKKLARELLPELIAADREAWFRRLAGEIPAGAWRRVYLNAADQAWAADHFADAELVVDDAMAGGLVVTDQRERLRVDNSLDKRLERLWPQLLPEVIQAVRKEVPAGAVATAERDT